MARRVIILGSTGSIGTQAIEVIEHLNALHARGESPDRFDIVGLAAGRNVALLSEQARRYPLAQLAIAHLDVRDLAIEEQGWGASFPGQLLNARHGPDAPARLVREVECDLVIAAIVGVAGLGSTLAAVEMGRDVALANKETLVAAGSLVTGAARRTGARLLPVDSEHSALWQCLLGASNQDANRACPPLAHGSAAMSSIRRATLTASGGPFRDWSLEQLTKATPADALKHPTWSMGSKITIDCATLMNKSLELIEAYWLFGLREDQLGMVVHPQSVVHAMVETSEGAVLAQMSAPDMRTPLQFALTHPQRVAPAVPPLDLARLSRLDFLPVDTRRFPAADLWMAVLGDRAGTTAGAILNAANEEAVLAFLGRPGEVAFTRIAEVVTQAVESVHRGPANSLDLILTADAAARDFVRRRLSRREPSAPSSSRPAR
jgi:1-deoxy-D-xylulose-5-phosphate reductoisomerase